MKKVKSVVLLEDFKLQLDFDTGECRIFDARPYLDKGIFRELQDPNYFRSARVQYGTVAWPNEQDFSPDTLYLESVAKDAEVSSRASR